MVAMPATADSLLATSWYLLAIMFDVQSIDNSWSVAINLEASGGCALWGLRGVDRSCGVRRDRQTTVSAFHPK
jgi:hypothetical protein